MKNLLIITLIIALAFRVRFPEKVEKGIVNGCNVTLEYFTQLKTK